MKEQLINFKSIKVLAYWEGSSVCSRNIVFEFTPTIKKPLLFSDSDSSIFKLIGVPTVLGLLPFKNTVFRIDRIIQIYPLNSEKFLTFFTSEFS